MPAVTAVTAFRTWINSLGTLVGPGQPLALGAYRQHPRSPGHGAYALISRVGGSDELTAEDGVDRARISASIYAGTDEAAEAAAVAYRNAIAALTGGRVQMGDATCLVIDNISGPLLIDNHDSEREQWQYVVDCDVFLV